MTACLCNDAQTQADADCKSTPPTVFGEPTEQALVEVANDFGFHQLELQRAFPRVDECPFDSDRKRMSTLHAVKPAAAESLGIVPLPLLDARRVAFIQGAIDSVLSVSTSVWTDGETAALNDEHRQRIARTRDELAATGARV